jgi:hypothetical protein
MSKENAIRFMMMKDKDEAIKSAFDAILSKCDGKILSKDDQDKVLREEVIPLAKKYGFDFTSDDLDKAQNAFVGRLSDEELDQIAGGKGQFTETFFGQIHGLISTYTCDYAPDDQTLETYYNQLSTGCPDYVHLDHVANLRMCVCCANLHSTSRMF